MRTCRFGSYPKTSAARLGVEVWLGDRLVTAVLARTRYPDDAIEIVTESVAGVLRNLLINQVGLEPYDPDDPDGTLAEQGETP